MKIPAVFSKMDMSNSSRSSRLSSSLRGSSRSFAMMGSSSRRHSAPELEGLGDSARQLGGGEETTSSSAPAASAASSRRKGKRSSSGRRIGSGPTTMMKRWSSTSKKDADTDDMPDLSFFDNIAEYENPEEMSKLKKALLTKNNKKNIRKQQLSMMDDLNFLK